MNMPIVRISDVEDVMHKLLMSDPWIARHCRGNIHKIPALSARADKDSRAQAERMFYSFPALGTYFPGGSFDTSQPLKLDHELSIVVLCAAANHREPGLAARGDAYEPGAWDLVDRVSVLLAASQPVGNVQSFVPKSWHVAWTNESVAVMAITTSVRVQSFYQSEFQQINADSDAVRAALGE